jgi:AcrR family transcriptional regulator
VTDLSDARRQRTRDRLFQATLEVALERGLAGVSTHRVAATAGLTTGAIYRNFDSRDHLIREAMAYYQHHVSDLDVVTATSVSEWAHGYVDAYLDIAASTDEVAQRILSLQQQVMTLRETDNDVRALVDEWQESRFVILESRVADLAALSGERLTIAPRVLAQQLLVVAAGFSHMVEHLGGLIPRALPHQAVDAVLAQALRPRRSGRQR